MVLFLLKILSNFVEILDDFVEFHKNDSIIGTM